MKTAFVLAALCVAAALAQKLNLEEIARKVNSDPKSTWRATHLNRFANAEAKDLKKLLGFDRRAFVAANPDRHQLNKVTPLAELQDIPDSFDSRTNWPDCPTMKEIRDQADCGSCWAFGAVEAMSDRECVYNNRVRRYSAEDMNSCSGCGGCDGADPTCAWNYWKRTGVISDECRAYSIPGCDHHVANSSNPCPSGEDVPTPQCKQTCVANSTLTWSKDKVKASSVYTKSGEQQIQAEIMKGGPVETALDVYSDFAAYTGGIYKKSAHGEYLGGHAVKFVGWGVENDTPYWIVANSWNPHWGEGGFFRILRGSDECGIEDTIWAGVPTKA